MLCQVTFVKQRYNSWCIHMIQKFGLFFILVLALVGLSALFSSSPPEEETGTIAFEEFQNKYTTILEEALAIIDTQGVPQAIEYTVHDGAEGATYGIRHFVLHEVGHRAYFEADEDIARALAFLPENASESHLYQIYDGYAHGVLHSFFTEERDIKTEEELVNASCPKYVNHTTMPDMRGFECFHGVGHAFMYSQNYDVTEALNSCANIAHAWKHQPCYYGVFMELTYPYWPFGGVALSPEGVVVDDSFFAVCEQLEGEQKEMCAHFVGEAHWASRLGDIEGAITQCMKFSEPTHQSLCVQRLSVFQIPNLYRDDLKGMVEFCLSLETEHTQNTCIRGITEGIQIGAIGLDAIDRYSEIDAIVKELSSS